MLTSIIYHLIEELFFDLTHLRELGQKYRNILVRFLVQMKTLKFASEINRPLGSCAIHVLSQELDRKQLLVIIAKSGYRPQHSNLSLPLTCLLKNVNPLVKM